MKRRSATALQVYNKQTAPLSTITADRACCARSTAWRDIGEVTRQIEEVLERA